MTENKILSAVSSYLSSHGYKVVRLNPKKLPLGIKCSDFEVFFKDSPNFYCEVKSPLLVQNEITKMFHWTTSVTKLRDLIHKAVEQFTDQDSQHKLPWVLIFTSDHMQLNWTNMTHAIAGKVYYGDKVIADLSHLSRVRDTIKDIDQIDLFVWMQMNEKGDIYQLRIMIQQKTKLMNKVKKISKKIVPLSTDKSFKR